jgi:hypothetical protein
MERRDRPGGVPADARLCEVAAILAAGLLRYRRMARMNAPAGPENPPDSGRNCLEDAAPPRISVPAGSTGYEKREPEKGALGT